MPRVIPSQVAMAVNDSKTEGSQRQKEARQGGGEVADAGNAINADRKFSPLDNMGIREEAKSQKF